jgi:hypothetical protein
MFHIAELLDLVLRFAGPEAQVRALFVLTAWRSSALSVISSRTNVTAFRSASVCAAIEYGQVVEDIANLWPRPTDDDIQDFSSYALRMIKRWEEKTTSKYFYFPARFTQLRGLPDTISYALQDFVTKQRNYDYHAHPLPGNQDTDRYWLDLTRFKINPYSELLFSEETRILHRLGR